MRPQILIGLVLAACLAGASAAAIATADKPAKREAGGSRVYASPYGRGGITLDAEYADNVITIRSDDAKGEFVITDQAGVKIDPRFPEYASLCNQISNAKVRCALQEPGGVRVGLGNGDDYLRVESTQHAPIVVGGDIDEPGDDVIEISNPPDATASRIQGYGGDDVIVAGPSGDRLMGGPGEDVIRGMVGDDFVDGGRGSDQLRGGLGSDKLDAEKDDEDDLINCGADTDTATVDPRLDPPPQRCEEVVGDEKAGARRTP